MTATIDTLDDYGYLSCLIGGIVTVVIALLGLIVSATGTPINWFLAGGGYIGLASIIAGTIVSMVFGILAILIGLKLFVQKFYDLLTRVDLVIIAIIMFVIGIIVFSIGGILIFIGGVLVLVFRLTPNGKVNPTGK